MTRRRPARAGASLTHAIVGNDVIIHAGVRIGQDGFGFAMSPSDLESGRRNEMHNSARLNTSWQNFTTTQ